MKLFRFLTAACLTIITSFAHAGSHNDGILYASGGYGGYDWYSSPDFIKPIASIATAPIKLQARFIWQGPAGNTWTGQDHAIVVYKQGENNAMLNSPLQPGDQQPILTHGVGAFVGSTGLNLEMWFDSGSAHVWNKNSLCGYGVAASGPNQCLDQYIGSNNYYLTPPPQNWQVKYGVPYWVRITITTDYTPGKLLLRAEFFEEVGGNVILLQQAAINFVPTKYLPYWADGAEVYGTVARAPGTGQNITYDVFDYGF